MALTTQFLNLTMESQFAMPVAFRQANATKIAYRFLEKFAGYGLRSSAITQDVGDALFNYGVIIQLFNGSANFALRAEKFTANFQNLRTDEDLNIVFDCLVKSHESLFDRKIVANDLQAHIHAVFPQEGEREKFLARYAQPDKGIQSAGLVVYGRSDPWQREIRLQVERSNLFPTGLFVSLQTAHEGLISRHIIDDISKACGTLLEKTGLTFTK